MVGAFIVEGSILGKEGGKRTLSTKSVSSEEVRDETSRVEGREGGKRTKSVSSEEVDETSGVEGREGGKKTWSAKSVSLEVEGVEET